jgi:hypothetical protein
MATLDDIRKNLKAKTATPAPLSGKSDPLAAVRANLKGGKGASKGRPKDALLADESSTSLRLARLEAAVNAMASGLSGTQLEGVKTAVSQAQ